MAGVDIHDLTREQLTEAAFPVNPQSDFRLSMAESVHKNIQQHAKADKSVEICGVLVGEWAKDKDGPFAVVKEYIRCDSATSKFAEVTFTHESWSHINQEMDSKYSNLRIVGWYHSHPDFGIFLSDRDVFIHEHFFSGAGQVAYVVDPVRDLEGVFIWRSGKPEPISHYWIGNEVRTADAAVRSPASAQKHAMGESANAPMTASSPSNSSMLPMLTTVLSWLLVFLLGYLIAGRRSAWEQNMIVKGAVAHYGLMKLMKPGFEETMTALEAHLQQLDSEFEKLPKPADELSEEEREEAAKRRKLIGDNLKHGVKLIGQVKDVYGLSEAEQSALARLIAQKEAELQGTSLKPEEPAKPAGPKAPDEKMGASPESSSKTPESSQTSAKADTTNETPAQAEKAEN